MKFRKLPVIIDAIQFTGGKDSAKEVQDWNISDYPIVWHIRIDNLSIYTLEGTKSANVGDWIIRGVKGEIYPCKPDIFDNTYEAIDEGN